MKIKNGKSMIIWLVVDSNGHIEESAEAIKIYRRKKDAVWDADDFAEFYEKSFFVVKAKMVLVKK